MKILLTLLAVAACAEATINLGSLLSLFAPALRDVSPVVAPVGSGYASYYRQPRAPVVVQPGYASYYRKAPAPEPDHSGYASYYRKAPAPAPAPVHAGYASYYRQAPAPAPAPVHAGYASYYRQAPAPAPAPVYSGYSSYYRQAPAPTPAPAPVYAGYASYYRQEPARTPDPIPAGHASYYRQAKAPAEPAPIIYIPRPTPEPATYYHHPAPPPQSNIVLSTPVHTPPRDDSISITQTHVELAAPEPKFTIVPSQSFSYTYSDAPASGAQVQSLPQPTINLPFNAHPAHSVQSDYSIEMVKSEGHSYALPEEHITLEKTVAPVTNVDVQSNAGTVQHLKLDVRTSATVEENPVALSAPIVVESTVETNAVEHAHEEPVHEEHAHEEPVHEEPAHEEPVHEEPVVQVTPAQEVAPVQPQEAPQALATVTLDQEDITKQILQQAIPDVIRRVAPHIIRQAIPLIVDRAVPHIVNQRNRNQVENVQIVTPFNYQQQQQQQQQQDQGEKVFVMYATSVPEDPSQIVFQQRGQYDESENLVVPIGNRNQYNGFDAAGAQANANAQNEQKIVFEKGLDIGNHVEEERRSVANVNQQIISNFQSENLAYQQERGREGAANRFSGNGSQIRGFSAANSFSGAGSQQGAFASASSFSGAGSQQRRRNFQNQQQQQYNQ